jgi:hypothetical protein
MVGAAEGKSKAVSEVLGEEGFGSFRVTPWVKLQKVGF